MELTFRCRFQLTVSNSRNCTFY